MENIAKITKQHSLTNLGQLVRRKRKTLGYTQEQLAMLADTGVRFVRDIEAGKTSIQADKAADVCAAVGISMVFEDDD